MTSRIRSRGRASGVEFTPPSPNLVERWMASLGTTVATGVSNWIGTINGRDMAQAVGGSQPALGIDADGRAIITFDGAAHNLKTANFTYGQPVTLFFVGRSVSWTINDGILDGNSVNSGVVAQLTSTPNIACYAGTTSSLNGDYAIGVNSVLTIVINGANSRLQVNKNTAVTGNFGSKNMNGFTLGARGDGTFPANIVAYDMILYSAALSNSEIDYMQTGLMAEYEIA